MRHLRKLAKAQRAVKVVKVVRWRVNPKTGELVMYTRKARRRANWLGRSDRGFLRVNDGTETALNIAMLIERRRDLDLIA